MRIVTFFGGSIQHKGDRIMKRSRINEVIRDMEHISARQHILTMLRQRRR